MTQQDGGALTIVLVMDTLGGLGNGTSNSAWQYARELTRQGHHVRMVGIGSPRYPARVHRVPFASWVAAKQRMQFAKPDVGLFERAFRGADVVHIYMPFAFGRCALRVARSMRLPVTAGFHLQPENITYSAGPLRYVPGISGMIYRLFRRWLYRDIAHIHVPSGMIAQQLRDHGYTAKLHIISNGYSPRFAPRLASRSASQARSSSAHGEPVSSPTLRSGHGGRPSFRVIASGRLTREKDQITLIRAVATCAHRGEIELVIAGTGPLRRRLQAVADRLLPGQASIAFCPNDRMPRLLNSGDLFVHTSVVDIESLSVLEAMSSGLVPVLAQSDLSAASQFALTPQSLFPARDVAALADRIDWWLNHPRQRARWAARYAEQARRRYRIETCVARFVDMEREAIADHRGAGRTSRVGRMSSWGER